MCTAGRADYFGPLVQRAARLCHGAAFGGQVVCPQQLAEELVSSCMCLLGAPPTLDLPACGRAARAAACCAAHPHSLTARHCAAQVLDWCHTTPEQLAAEQGPAPWQLRAQLHPAMLVPRGTFAKQQHGRSVYERPSQPATARQSDAASSVVSAAGLPQISSMGRSHSLVPARDGSDTGSAVGAGGSGPSFTGAAGLLTRHADSATGAAADGCAVQGCTVPRQGLPCATARAALCPDKGLPCVADEAPAPVLCPFVLRHACSTHHLNPQSQANSRSQAVDDGAAGWQRAL